MGRLRNLFRTIFLVDLLKGLWLTLRYTPAPAFTFQYPAERRPVAPRFRGILRLQVEPETGAPTCIVCDQCARVCPDDRDRGSESAELVIGQVNADIARQCGVYPFDFTVHLLGDASVGGVPLFRRAELDEMEQLA